MSKVLLVLYVVLGSISLLAHATPVQKVANGTRMGWRNNANARKVQKEWGKHVKAFKDPDHFAEVQDKLESIRKKAAREAGKVFNIHRPLNKSWTKPDATEQGLNADAGMSDLLYDGDIIPSLDLLNKVEAAMNEEDTTTESTNSTGTRKKRKVINTNYISNLNYWPDNTVYYELDYTISASSDHLAAVNAAMNFWKTNTCVDFVQSSTETNRIFIYVGQGCNSAIGQEGGKQLLSLGNGCQYTGIVEHELGHAMGFFHEQARSDRDSYVMVNTDDIQTSFLDQYKKYGTNFMNYFNQPYDYGSVMHYSPLAFAVSTSKPTLTSSDSFYQNTMGQRNRASFVDVAQINAAYRCSDSCSNSINCENGGIQNSRNCNTCICPEGFGGATCTAIEASHSTECGGVLTAQTYWKSLTFTTSSVGKCVWLIKSAVPGFSVQVDPYYDFTYPCNQAETCTTDYLEIKFDSDLRRAGGKTCCHGINRPSYFIAGTTGVVISQVQSAGIAEFTLYFIQGL